MTGDSKESVPAYVAFKSCGCVVAAVVDDGTRNPLVAKSVAEWLRKGAIVERKTVGWARQNLRFCDCDKKPKQEAITIAHPAAVPRHYEGVKDE